MCIRDRSFENYRPISLLNTLYKIFASILHHRISSVIDPHLQKTQFGFRKHRSTSDAIHAIRRLMDYSEITGRESIFLFLDWEKAFDKITHKALLHSLQRAQLPEKFLRIIQCIYSEPQFFVSDDIATSNTLPQHTGIRQGCPLSPFLFLIVMHLSLIHISEPTRPY